MSAQHPFGRAASADLIGRSPQRLVRTSSARETSSPGVMSSGSSSDGGASLGARLGNLSIGEANASIFSAPRSALPAGMSTEDDPFGTYTVPSRVHSSYEVERAEPHRSYDGLDNSHTGYSQTHQVYNHHEAPQREERQLETRRGRYDDDHGVDAQVFYPASSCVFVANLPESMENVKLHDEIDKKFGNFGTCFVKIRRDKKNMPFAFVQYTNDRDATKARAQGAGIVFQGRPCRTEAVRANRTFILRNYVGGTVSMDEARDVLAKYGAIGRLEEIDRDVAELHGIDQGVLVEFKNFDPDRDIQASFRHHAIYRVVSHDVHRTRRSDNTADSDHQASQRRFDIDRRSVFIGNLPNDVEGLEREVRLLAGEIGHVVNMQIIRKEGRPGYGTNVFAFVEYSRPEIAEMAADDLSGRRIFGCRIRVEQKESRQPMSNDRYARRTIRHASPENRSVGQAANPYTPRRVDNGGPEAMTSMPAATLPMNPVISPYAAWNPYGSPSYTTAPYMPTGMEGAFPPHPQYLPPSMAWAAPYMSDPALAPQAYWTALNHAYGTPFAAAARPARESGSDQSRGSGQPSSERN